ncbi:MAG: hypothetical protein H0U90_06615 [Actinobacteria bacterium]|nr:hypothetical protein [Actinomycetota bacterium]
MRFYPDVPAQRLSTAARDLVVLILLALFAWLAVAVHDAVDALAVLGEGVGEAGESVQGGFGTAADAVDDVPVVGGTLADGLRAAGEGSGGNVAEVGRRGEERVHELANLLGVLTFGIPATLLLVQALPPRIAQVRQLTAAGRALRDGVHAVEGAERTRLVAMRAAFSLPYGQLLRFTPDPFGDLAAGRYDDLVRAAYEDAGLRSERA